MRSRSNGGVIGAYALPNQNRANGVFFIHDAAIFNTGANPIWPLASGFITSASGGTIAIAADNSNYRTHTFTANGTFTVTTGSAFIDIFLVGGGGSGGSAYQPSTSTTAAAGGGAGGVVLLAQNVWVNGGTTFTVEVGLGGSLLTNVLVESKPSRVTSVSGYSYVAVGGGYGGGRRSSVTADPTSGGGAFNISVTQSTALAGGAAPTAGTGSPGTITSNTYVGGSAIGLGASTNRWMGGGGAGATGAGYDNNYSFDPAKAGNGGDGYYYSRTGFYYGAGGGAGVLGTGWSGYTYYNQIGRGGLVYDGSGWANGGRTQTVGTALAGLNSPHGYGGGGGGAVQYATTNSTVQAGTGGNGTVIFSYRYR
jgi:hypothetical protein